MVGFISPEVVAQNADNFDFWLKYYGDREQWTFDELVERAANPVVGATTITNTKARHDAIKVLVARRRLTGDTHDD